MTIRLGIIFSVLFFVSAAGAATKDGIPSSPYITPQLASRVAASTTDDIHAIMDFPIAGVWFAWHPAFTEAEYYWLHPDGTLAILKGNCEIIFDDGKWRYDAAILELIDPERLGGGIFSVMVTRVPKKYTALGDFLVMEHGGYMWGSLGRETEEGCS